MSGVVCECDFQVPCAFGGETRGEETVRLTLELIEARRNGFAVRRGYVKQEGFGPFCQQTCRNVSFNTIWDEIIERRLQGL